MTFISGQSDVTPVVLDVMRQTTDPRLCKIMTSLVSHLHAFVREVRLSEEEFNPRGKFVTGPDGAVRFSTVKPVGHPIPTDTTVGRLLATQGLHPYRTAQVHVLAHEPGFKTLISQTYVAETGYLTSDVQFGVTPALIGRLVRHDEPHPVDGDIGEWFTLEHSLELEPGESNLPLPPIT